MSKLQYFLYNFGFTLTEYKKNVLLLCLFLAIGTCQIVPAYATMVGEIRTKTGEYLGGS